MYVEPSAEVREKTPSRISFGKNMAEKILHGIETGVLLTVEKAATVEIKSFL
jgi:hypothetical protein